MKSIHQIIVGIVLLNCLNPARAGETIISATSVALEAANEYKAALDQVIAAAVAKGKVSIEAGDVASLRGLEYELLSYARLGVIKKADFPSLIFAQGKPTVSEEIPGRTLELRLLKLNINPWEDGLTNKFEFTNEYGTTAAFVRPTATNTYPRAGDFRAAYAFAADLIRRREWADADRILLAAAAIPGGTSTHEWEFQIQVTRAWVQFMIGAFPKAKTTLEEALGRDHQCEVPVRGRYLARILGIEGQHLSPELQAALPDGK